MTRVKKKASIFIFILFFANQYLGYGFSTILNSVKLVATPFAFGFAFVEK